MYESFFRFTERPFAVLPDSSRIFWTDGHRNAFSVLEVGLDRLSQVTVLTGGIGTGKTTLIRHLLQTTSSAFTVGMLSNFAGERDDLLPWVLSAFGLNVSASSEAVMFRRLERFFAGELHHGRRSVLIVDEAQNLCERDLESLRLLGNLNAEEVLMMLILVGQPQLRAKMTRAENRQLWQRVGADYHLEPLSQDETARFVRHRCVQAGGSASLFGQEALDEVHRVSGGVPRKINVLCDLALVSAYADGVRKVDYRIVRSVLEDARRHGTYTSLTEQDIVAAPQTGLAVGGEDQPLSATAVRAGPHDPVQRLTRALESGGGGPRRAHQVERASGLHDASAAPLPPGRPAPAAATGSADLNALFEMAWPDDTLLFVTDAADGQAASAPMRGRPAAPDGGGQAPDGPGQGETDDIGARPEGARDVPTPQAPAAATTAPTFDRPAPPPSPSIAELALRQAFTAQAGWRRIGWRGGAIAAIAASGSVAAGIVIAMLPDWATEGAPQAAVAEASTEAPLAAPQVLAKAEAPSLTETAGRAGAADPAQGAGATGAAVEHRTPRIALSAEAHETSNPAQEDQPALAESGARFSPVALSLADPRLDETPLTPAEAASSGQPASAGPMAKLADAAPAGGPGQPLRPAGVADHRPIRLDQPHGLGMPDGAAEEALSIALPRSSAGSPPTPAPDQHGPAFADAGTVEPAPRTVPAASAPGAGRAAAPGLEAVPPHGAEPLPRHPAATSVIEARRTAPALPAAPALPRTAGPRVPPETELPLLEAAAPIAAPDGAASQTGAPTIATSVEADPEAMFRYALDTAIEDSRAAVIGYARAALLGHERAAYYLGQIYETGDGVPVDFAIARHWYEVASDANPRAEDRLAELPRPEQGGEMVAPMPLLAQWLDAGQADFVWTSGEGADPAAYVVEVSAEPSEGAAAAYPVTGSAARLIPVEGVTHWRVLALDAPGGRDAASVWRVIAPARSDRSAAARTPADHL